MLKNRKLAMALKTLVGGAVLVGTTAFVTTRVLSDDKPSTKEEEMAKAMQNGMPGANHKFLESFVGEWNAENKAWMEPGQPPMTTKATSSNRWVMDGRFVQQEYSCDWEGMPFKGMSLIGYDNHLKKYNSTWIDNMSTSLFYSTGTTDDSGKTFTFEGETPDCMTGKLTRHRSVYKVISKDKHIFEMYKGEGGKWDKMMEITYTRK